MKVNEICIGNFLIGENGEVHIVEAITKLSIKTTSLISNSSSTFYYPIKPFQIPLTNEWLVDLGFARTLHETVDINSDYYWSGEINLYVFKDENIIVLGSLENGKCSPLLNVVDLKYVSQIQNLSYMLTGNELTKRPNLKIKWDDYLNQLRSAKLGDSVRFEFDDRIAEVYVNNELSKKGEELNCHVFIERNEYSIVATFRNS